MKLTKGEIKAIKDYHNDEFDLETLYPMKVARGKKMLWLIVISHGRRELHDSGYPFIKIIGKGDDGNFYNLGWHDHFISYVPTNTDSLGKNVFRVAPWDNGPWVVSDNFWSSSTFQIGTPPYYSDYDPNKVILQ